MFGKNTYAISDSNGTYTITYWQEGQGILRYSYKLEKDYSSSNKALQDARFTCIAIAAPIVVAGFIMSGSATAATVIPFAAAYALAA